MTFDDAFESLSKAYRHWAGLGIIDDPNFSGKDGVISWGHRALYKIGRSSTYEDLAQIMSERNYSLRIMDGKQEHVGVIQLYYDFRPRQRVLKEASLAYLGAFDLPEGEPTADEYFATQELSEIEGEPVESDPEPVNEPGSASGDEATDVSASEEPFEQEMNLQGGFDVYSLIDDSCVKNRIVWARLDYKPSDKRGVLHPAAHLHTSSFPEGRILVHGVPNPGQFIEWLVSLVYPEFTYRDCRLKPDGNYQCNDTMRTLNRPWGPKEDPHGDEFLFMSHLFIPDGLNGHQADRQRGRRS